jgi:hypothetical protein
MDISPVAEPRDVEGRVTRSRTGFSGGRGDYRPAAGLGCGREGGIRTRDLSVPNRVPYQTDRVSPVLLAALQYTEYKQLLYLARIPARCGLSEFDPADTRLPQVGHAIERIEHDHAPSGAQAAAMESRDFVQALPGYALRCTSASPYRSHARN